MRQELIEALQRLARGHVDAAETIVDLVMPQAFDPRKVVDISMPLDELHAAFEAQAAEKAE